MQICSWNLSVEDIRAGRALGNAWRVRRALIPSAEEKRTEHSESGTAPLWGCQVLPARHRPTHRGVWHTAGEGHPTLLSAVAGTTAVEVDIEVPVFRAVRSATLVLQSQSPEPSGFPSQGCGRPAQGVRLRDTGFSVPLSTTQRTQGPLHWPPHMQRDAERRAR